MKKFFLKSFKIFNVVLILITWAFIAYVFVKEIKEKEEKKQKDNDYNVALIKINNSIAYAMVEKLYKKIEKAEQDQKVKAVIYDFNSGGGEISPSFEIESMVRNSVKFKIANIHSMAASGAYLIASATDSICATMSSGVGSISAKISYIESSKKLEKEGKKYINLISGKYKGLYDRNKSITQEEKNVLLGYLKYHHNNFVNRVSKNRNIPMKIMDTISDGRLFYGKDAINVKLVDNIIENRNDIKFILEQKLDQEIKIKVF